MTTTRYRCTLYRASVCIWSEELDEQSAFDLWLRNWKDKLVYVSHNYGCGCCVSLYDVEGEKDAIDALPNRLRTPSRWTEGIE